MLFSKCETSFFTLAKGISKSGIRKLSSPLLMISLFLLPAMVQAQEKPSSTENLDEVVFIVDGKEYTNRDLAAASIDFRPELEKTPADKRREAVIEIMINTILIAKEAETEKLNEIDEYKRRFELLRARTLRNFYLNKIIRPKVTEELTQERYVELLARFKPETEIRARHILVETEEAAKALIVEIDGGKDFAELAKEKSTGPSAPNGGNLGFFNKNQMVSAFHEAATKLRIGEHSKEPVKTQFGWHIIKKEEIRESTAPTYQQVVSELQNQVYNSLFAEKVSELRKTAKIEIKEETQAQVATPDDKKKAE
ncbi:MAG: peptidylprolyl isomerase [Hyphomicrobiales bacterium]